MSCYEGDPNYDLFQLACRVSSKRLFPNFAFLDAPYNLKYYVPGRYETEVAYMGCRTRVIGNVHDPDREIAPGRGNLSFTSIKLAPVSGSRFLRKGVFIAAPAAIIRKRMIPKAVAISRSANVWQWLTKIRCWMARRSAAANRSSRPEFYRNLQNNAVIAVCP